MKLVRRNKFNHKIFLEKIIGPKFLRNIRGLIAVTDEIRKVELLKIFIHLLYLMELV